MASLGDETTGPLIEVHLKTMLGVVQFSVQTKKYKCRKSTTISNSKWTGWSTIQGVIKTLTKFSNVIGYQQPDLSINWTVAHVLLVIGQYAPFCACCCGALC